MDSDLSLIPDSESAAVGNDPAGLVKQIHPVEQVPSTFLAGGAVFGKFRITEMTRRFYALNHESIPSGYWIQLPILGAGGTGHEESRASKTFCLQ